MGSDDFDTINKGRLAIHKRPKSGRPRKDPKQKLSNRLQIAFTDDEWSKLSHKAESDCRLPTQVVRLFLINAGFFNE
jgi:hypothetical protein